MANMTVAQCIAYVESHMQINTTPLNGAYKAGRVLQPPKGGLNHSVGCAQPRAQVFVNHMNKSDCGWGVNAILGDFDQGEGVIMITLLWSPEDKKVSRPWGCGAGSKGSYNNTHVQWEVCEPAGHTYAGGTMVNYDVAKNQAYFDRMWKMLVAWNVYCAVKFGYGADTICDHAESYKAGMGSNHSDMSQWLPKHGKSMDILRQEVKAILVAHASGTELQQPQMPNTAQLQPAVSEYDKWLKHYQTFQATKLDNDCGDWSAAARQWATGEAQLISGIGGGNYAWEAEPTREQLVTIMYRYNQYMDEKLANFKKDMLAAVKQLLDADDGK